MPVDEFNFNKISIYTTDGQFLGYINGIKEITSISKKSCSKISEDTFSFNSNSCEFEIKCKLKSQNMRRLKRLYFPPNNYLKMHGLPMRRTIKKSFLK